LPTDRAPGAPPALTIPLSRWADRQLRALARETGSAAIAALTGAQITGERGAANDFRINGTVSAGLGGSRMNQTRDGGWFALTLLRPEDRDLLPALFGEADVDTASNEAIARAVARHDCDELLARGRALGLPVASADESPASPPVETLTVGSTRRREPTHRPLVIDLSAIWAGPLAGHFLWQAGAQVVKVESLTRPDLIRRDDIATFGRINQGKANIALDFHNDAQKAALIDLIRRADIVIESSRPRALRHLGIDAESLVRDVPGLVWLTVTGHGATGDAANWAGIGNDCGVAAGLSRAMERAGGTIGYVGDALPDPLTGITAAREGWAAYRSGKAQRLGFSMTAITARALAEEHAFDAALLDAELRAWSEANGPLMPAVPLRPLAAPVSHFGADTARYLPEIVAC
jgi:crotonobetainyl-CoA:carnitine CoA-transferase CaiB-like acyl-CoA transferase